MPYSTNTGGGVGPGHGDSQSVTLHPLSLRIDDTPPFQAISTRSPPPLCPFPLALPLPSLLSLPGLNYGMPDPSHLQHGVVSHTHNAVRGHDNDQAIVPVCDEQMHCKREHTQLFWHTACQAVQ